MLESLRKQGASIAIYLIFGLLIVIFVINFAPNAGQGSGGCMGSAVTPMKVDGQKTNQTAYKVAYSGNQSTGRQKVYVALEMLIRREILAQEAEKRGLRVTGEMLDEAIKKGYFFLGGQRNELDLWIDTVGEEKFFNFQKLKGWVGQLNVSMNSYKDEQARGLQAALMAELLADSVRVSREEALADYLYENNTVSYDMVEFSPTPYKVAMRLGDADVERFIAGHEADVKKKFTDDERTYKATKPALKLRSIFIQKLVEAPKAPEPPPAPPTDGAGSGSAAGSGAGSATPPADKTAQTPPAPKKPEETKPEEKPIGMPIDAAKATLEATRKAIADGKQKFADAAKLLSTDDAAKANGGYVGWKPVDNAQLGDKAVNDAVKTLKAGEMTPVITTDNGAYLVIAEAAREGDLTYDQVKHEIATELAKDVWSKEAAKRAALDALAQARAGTGKTLDQLFKADPAEMQRKMQEDIQRQIQMQMMQQQKSGFYTPPSATKDVPASWYAQANGPSGSGSAGSGSAGSAAAGSGSAAAGSAAAGSGAGSAPAPTPSTTSVPAEAPILEATKDVLPAFGTIETPFLEAVGPVPKATELPGVGTNKAAIESMFDELTPGMLAKQVYESDGSYVVLQLKDKQQPKIDEFEKTADQRIETLRSIRGAMMLQTWLKERCEQYQKDGKIEPMADLIRETDDKGNPLPASYRPCMSFR
jgi:parvulin-like peptidyl-prolyl isomerase